MKVKPATQKNSMGGDGPIDPDRRAAILSGVLFIIGTIAGVLSVVVTAGLLDAPGYLSRVAANPSQAMWAAMLILVMGIALAMIPATLFPILKRQNEALAIAYVVFRGALETFITIVAAIFWLLLVLVARQYVDSGTAVTSQFDNIGVVLVKANADQIPAILAVVFSLGAMMFNYMLYQARLIPRWISGWGFVASMVYLAGGLLAVFGTHQDILLIQMLPQEMVMAVWLIVKGFTPSANAALSAKPVTV